MHVALTGSTGFIGAAVAAELSRSGCTVRGLVRQTSRRDHVEDLLDETIVADMADRTMQEPLLDGVEALIHNAVDWNATKNGDLARHLDVNLSASIELLDLAARRDLQVVFVSSVAVHHDMLPQWNGKIDATHPTRPGSPYGACKAAIEAHLWSLHASHNLQFTIIRPSAVYGIDPRLDRSIGAKIITQVRTGKPFTRMGGGKFVHVDDVAASIVRPLQCDTPSGGIYHLADCYARWAEWAQMVSDIVDVSIEIDTSSPTAPKNMFETDALAKNLGVHLNRGHAGIRTYLEELATLC
ncbi:MAG: NAD-dependent epimerase/dehydratase family protein [Phycisphaerales bacterium]|nr:NAD-dependent epimerase/dehydratase family protein [Phycisphaerales bacterium]